MKDINEIQFVKPGLKITIEGASGTGKTLISNVICNALEKHNKKFTIYALSHKEVIEVKEGAELAETIGAEAVAVEEELVAEKGPMEIEEILEEPKEEVVEETEAVE